MNYIVLTKKCHIFENLWFNLSTMSHKSLSFLLYYRGIYLVHQDFT